MAAHNELGKWGEDIAVTYLVKKGYDIRERDWRLGKRDVDIIALTEDRRTLVFIEVKTRRTDDLFDPTDAVNRQKIRSIGYCANAYIKTFTVDLDIRFDVITIVGSPETEASIEHIEDAFNPCLL